MANPQVTVRITGWLTANVPILCGPRPLSWEGPKDGGATSILIHTTGWQGTGRAQSEGWTFPGRLQALPHRPYFHVCSTEITNDPMEQALHR